jgi:signal transduction histidine kinase
MTKKVAKGNLTQRLEITSHDELGKLGTSFNKMVEDLETTTTSIENLNKEITERKKMEAALLQTEKLRAMGVMTSGVAHDFNNILAIISGHTQLLEGNYKEDKKLTDITRTIYKAAEDGAGIVRRMRQFTKMERDTSMFVSVNIKKVLEDAVDFLKPRWMNIAIVGRNPFDMNMDDIKEVPSILGNPSELREVFINIINNAMDAMPGGGRISFRTWSGKDTVFVRITDTGEGMSEEVKERIFDPFFTTKRAEGSGLGMSISYSVIKRHDGKIEVESEEGKGTAFNLSIPICKEAVQKIVSTEPGQEITTRKLRILVVDDENNLCVLLDGFLSSAGHDVKAITSGKEAIELIKSEEYDLVLSDLVMPGLSGYDVIQALDKLDKRPKVGLITGWKEEIENKDKEGLNVDFILRKPFDLTVLTKHINDVIDAG